MIPATASKISGRLIHKAGDVITEARTVTHWAENKTSSKVVLVGVDIIKNP